MGRQGRQRYLGKGTGRGEFQAEERGGVKLRGLEELKEIPAKQSKERVA